ncbi:MAG: fumarate hydratase, partial [Rhodospirillales bacterium]|nr:fumarate hydratase [Rhodospirillales bacterium]
MKIDLQSVEETARDLYIRALKLLPTDIKQGLVRLKNSETNERAQGILTTMMKNVEVAEADDNLLCQDTG